MVQEFHVLRCFSCQTFQVHQVKKSKKWTCKVCGEKQSVIKEYGQGAAADCRRHVQKLNSLHGELLKVNSERVLSQWEQGTDDQTRSVDEDYTSNESEKVDSVSRWSKYMDQNTEDPKQDGEEKEEEHIYTERDQFRNKETRKRKFVSKLKSVGDRYCEHEDSYTGFRGVKRQPHQPLQRDGMLSSSWNKGYMSLHNSKEDVSCTSTHLPSHPKGATSYPSASTSYTLANSSKVPCNFSHNQERVTKYLPQLNQDPSTPSSNQTFTESKRKNNDSKWNKFLTAVPSQEKDDMNHHLLSSAVFKSTEPLTDIYSEEHSCPPVEKTDTGVPGSHTPVDGFYNINSHTVNSEAAETVSKQPLQTNRSCPGFSSNSLFFTDEDFDDTL